MFQHKVGWAIPQQSKLNIFFLFNVSMYARERTIHLYLRGGGGIIFNSEKLYCPCVLYTCRCSYSGITNSVLYLDTLKGGWQSEMYMEKKNIYTVCWKPTSQISLSLIQGTVNWIRDLSLIEWNLFCLAEPSILPLEWITQIGGLLTS